MVELNDLARTFDLPTCGLHEVPLAWRSLQYTCEFQMTQSKRTIFVSIASYCDELLWWTVRSAWKTAAHPERLVFGIVEQAPQRSADADLNGPWSRQVRYVHVVPKDSRGACWARSVVFALYAGEDYLLQIDSHTMFEKNWDCRLVGNLEDISAKHENDKVILSTRPFGFELDERGEARTKVYTKQSLVLRPKPGVIFKDDHPILPFEAFASGKEEPVLGFQIAAGFIFTRGSFVEEVPYDPQLYFHGEEQNLAVRAFTRGWDIWHPNGPPLFHQYKDHAKRSYAVHWSVEHDRERSVRWEQFERMSKARMRQLLFDRFLLGVYGLGIVRTLSAFSLLSGINYPAKELAPPQGNIGNDRRIRTTCA